MNKGRLYLIVCVTFMNLCHYSFANANIVINEIHYHPPSDYGSEEYVELYNYGSEPIDLSGWAFVDGIYYTFPMNTIIDSDGYLLVAKDMNLVQGMAPQANVIGNYEGNLADSNERIELINAQGEIIESIHYHDRHPWPTTPDGQGSSLERISPFDPADTHFNWQSGSFLNRSDWVYVQVSGFLDNDEIKLYLTNNASIRIDEISLLTVQRSEELLSNNSFENPLNSNWEAAGSHEGSNRTQYSSSLVGNYIFELKADNTTQSIDHDYVKITELNIEAGEIYHLSFWMRITNGVGDLVIHGGDNFTRTIPLRNVPITPGQQNTAYSVNLPPNISEVTWSPHSPSPSESVQITATLEDQDGILGAYVEYQTGLEANFGSFQKIQMVIDQGNDTSGTWVATLPPAHHLTVVRFRIIAIDQNGQSRVYPHDKEGKWSETYIHYDDSTISAIPIIHFFTPNGYDQDDQLRGNSIMVVRPPNEPRWDVYDHVMINTRASGFNVFFLKQYEYEEMSSINVIFETKSVDGISDSRYALAEWLSYQVHQSIGTIGGKANHCRLFFNGNPRGFYLLFEQPNKNMIARHGIDNSGSLYKIIWNNDRSPTRSNIVRQHEKKTYERSNDYEDVIEMIQNLHSLNGQAQTVFIESNFSIDTIINYYVGCQLTSDWDGYFNNHFVYYDFNTSGLWYVFPWDKDKTFGDSDAYRSILPYYEWYDFPILFGAEGTPRSGLNNGTWWREPGFISQKFLANQDIQLRYLHRLGYVAETEFTEEKWFPIINALEERLEPEIRYRAQLNRQNVSQHLNLFHNNIESLRRQVTNRRQFIISEVEKLIGPVSVKDWNLY